MTTPPPPPGTAPTWGQWVDAMLLVPGNLNRALTLLEVLVRMAGESQAALAELNEAITQEMRQVEERAEASEARVRALLEELGATQEQLDRLDLGIATEIRAARQRVMQMVPDTPADPPTDTGGTGGDGGAAGDPDPTGTEEAPTPGTPGTGDAPGDTPAVSER